MTKKRFVWVILCLFFLAASLQAQIGWLHSFAGGATDGQNPHGSLILKGTAFYGMTHGGGTSDAGMIFKINTNGTGFAVLHSFQTAALDGAFPSGSLITKGSTLYGMTYGGGSSNSGTVFKINTNGTGFAVLHSFAGGASDGRCPLYGSLILKGSTLYGMTTQGGTSNWGTIFKINKNGTGFAVLHSFAWSVSDGAFPLGSLIAKGSTLYGMTRQGGTASIGTVFKINANGTGFAVLHSFAGGAADGGYPRGSLIATGSTLYGMTEQGGTDNLGSIFTIKTNGTGFGLLHSFAGGAADGANPYGSLKVKGYSLYGMTYAGGASDYGVIFSYSLK